MTIDEMFIKRLVNERSRRDWSQAELSRRVTALGHKLDKDAMSKIEKGSRRVTLADAVALAAALDVPLDALLLDTSNPEGDPVRLAPDLTLRMPFAAAWFTGRMPLSRENLRLYQRAVGRVMQPDWLTRLLLHNPNPQEIEMARAHVELERKRADGIEETASQPNIPADAVDDLYQLAERARNNANRVEEILNRKRRKK
jgi:transcriptional regulator with XRE-family HTH domain